MSKQNDSVVFARFLLSKYSIPMYYTTIVISVLERLDLGALRTAMLFELILNFFLKMNQTKRFQYYGNIGLVTRSSWACRCSTGLMGQEFDRVDLRTRIRKHVRMYVVEGYGL